MKGSAGRLRAHLPIAAIYWRSRHGTGRQSGKEHGINSLRDSICTREHRLAQQSERADRDNSRGGSLRTVRELVQRIETFVARYTRTSPPFARTVNSILAKLTRLAKAIDGTSH